MKLNYNERKIRGKFQFNVVLMHILAIQETPQPVKDIKIAF